MSPLLNQCYPKLPYNVVPVLWEHICLILRSLCAGAWGIPILLAMPIQYDVFDHRVWALHTYAMHFRLNLISSFKWLLYSYSQPGAELRERRSCFIMFINVLKLCAHLFWVWKKSKLGLQKVRRSESINSLTIAECQQCVR